MHEPRLERQLTSEGAMSQQAEDPATNEAELQRMRDEVTRLQAALDERAHHGGSGPRDVGRTRSAWWRVLVVTVCLVLVGVLAPLAVVATWAHDQVADTDRYVETVAPLAEKPSVQDAVSARLTAEITDRLEIRAVTQDAIDALAEAGVSARATASLSALATPLTQAVENFIGEQVARLVASDAFAQAWEQANREAHTQMVAVLTGETGAAIEVTGNAVQLNLAVLIDAVKTRLIDAGFTLAERLPEVTATFTLFQSADLAKAQTGFRLLESVARVLPILALIALFTAVFVGRRRRRTLMVGALVVAGSMILLGVILNVFRIVYLDAVPSETLPADAAGDIYDQLVWFIRLGGRGLLVFFLAVALVAWVSGPEPAPTAVRRGATRALDAVRHRRDRAGLRTGQLGAFLDSYRTPLRALVLGAAVLVYALADHPTGGSTLALVIITAVALLLIELLAGGPAESTRAEAAAETSPPPSPPGAAGPTPQP
jgi:hypothetical protein